MKVKVLMAMLAGFATAVQAAESRLVIYPEYPPQIERDHAYRIKVSQSGGGAWEIPVYNHCEKSSLTERTRGGDVNRRFCEFAFSGEPVRVDVEVCEDVKNYSVFPASRGLRHSFRDGVISVWLERPTLFGIRLNDYDKTILSVFADPPENPGKIPQKGDPAVLFVDGWLDATAEDGTIVVDGAPLREVYVAPGAVLNARLVVKAGKARIHGRGMILDPFSDVFRFDQTKSTKRLVVNVSGAGTVIEDIKLIDARTFNFGSWAPDVTMRNVKALSSMMCSDGITSGTRNLLVDGAWLYVGDNALVVSGLKDSTYRNVAIGTSCNAIFPQFENENILMDGVDVFRADEGLVKNTYNGALRRNVKWDELSAGGAKRQPGPQDLLPRRQSFLFRNLSAVDCILFSRFFVGGNMGTLPKTFAFENLSIPYSTGDARWRSIGKTSGVAITIYDDPAKWLVTDNYSLAITNLWLGGVPASEFAPETIKNGKLARIDIVNRVNASSTRPLLPNRAKPNWDCPWEVFVGDALQRDWRLVDRKAGERRLPPPPAGENLVADRSATRSDWQRCPSWMTKFEATATDGGARIYRLVQCEKGAGMQNVMTDRFLRHGPGKYRLSFNAAASIATNAVAVPMTAKYLSNEKVFTTGFELPADGAWHHFELDADLDFDLAGTDLVALQLLATVPTDEIKFKNLSLTEGKATQSSGH